MNIGGPGCKMALHARFGTLDHRILTVLCMPKNSPASTSLAQVPAQKKSKALSETFHIKSGKCS